MPPLLGELLTRAALLGVGGTVFLCFGRGLCFNRADPQPSSTVASSRCTASSRGIISSLLGLCLRLTLLREP